MEGAQTDVLGPASLAVVAATGVHALPGSDFPEALSQVLLVGSTLALRVNARRIVNPEEYGGHLFLDESGGPVMLDAAGLEEAVSAWLVDASGSRTDGYLTANSQPAQPSSAVRAQRNRRADGVADLAESEEEIPALARAADHSELLRHVSSLQQQVADAAGAHTLQVPQQRMPSLSQRAAGAGHSVAGHVSSSSSRPFTRASFGAAAASTPVVMPSYALLVPIPPQVPCIHLRSLSQTCC